MTKDKAYVKRSSSDAVYRVELVFAPFLIGMPILVALLFLREWYLYGYLLENQLYSGQIAIALLLLLGNILFDIPFLKALWKRSKTT